MGGGTWGGGEAKAELLTVGEACKGLSRREPLIILHSKQRGPHCPASAFAHQSIRGDEYTMNIPVHLNH